MIWCWHQTLCGRENGGKEGSKRWQRIVGRLWVVGWTWLISVWTIDPGLKLGTYNMSALPFPIVEPTLNSLGFKGVVDAIINWDF